MTPFRVCAMYRPLSAGLLPAGTTLLTYYFLYWRRLLSQTKTEPVPDSKQSRRASAVSFEVDAFTESKQPTALKRQAWQMTQTNCVAFPLGMSNATGFVVKARGGDRRNSYLSAGVIAARVWQGETGTRNGKQSSDTLVNPIALLVKSRKEMSPHIGLTAGINRAPKLLCASHEMNSPQWMAGPLGLME